MDVIISGTIFQALPPQSGVSQRGTQWSRASYVIEHESGQYPKRMVFDVKDAKIQEFNLRVGEQVTLHLNISCHEYPENSGRYFNSIEAWKVERVGYQQPAVPQTQYQQAQYQQPMPQQGYQVQQPAPFPPQQQYQQPVQSPFPPQQPVAQQAAPQQQVAQGQQAPLPFPPAQ